ncbi:MAG: hypothetical protein Q9160_000693 [Pyrenula sp. 1 TL-2023]
MAQAALNGVFLALTLIPLASEFFPKKYEASTTVRVAAGMTKPGEGGQSTGGFVPNIALFDPNGGRLGFMSGFGAGKVGDGKYQDIKIPHIDPHNNRPAEYMSLSSSGTDAICIAYLGITWADGSNFKFFGDTGQQCNKPWYPSNLPVPLPANPNYKPSCFWIDQPDSGSSGLPAGVSFHVTDFGTSTARAYAYQVDQKTMCESKPRLKFWENVKMNELQCVPIFDPVLPYDSADGTDPEDKSLLYVEGKRGCDPGPGEQVSPGALQQLRRYTTGRLRNPTYGVPNLKRDLDLDVEAPTKRVPAKRRIGDFCNDGRIVVSDDSSHSARELCESPSSMGPDFYHTVEQLYCDMCSKHLYPVCTEIVTNDCFNKDTQKVVPKPGLQERAPEKKYDTLVDWTTSSR